MKRTNEYTNTRIILSNYDDNDNNDDYSTQSRSSRCTLPLLDNPIIMYVEEN